MLKFSLILSAIISTTYSYANCENDNLVLRILLSEETFQESYYADTVELSENDSIVILEKHNQRTTILTYGTLINNGHGNFTLAAENDSNFSMYIDHDHEIYRSQGVRGGFNTPEFKYDFVNMYCSFEDLFLINKS